MELKYIVKREDENKKIGKILKDKLYISAILLNKLKSNNYIFVNGKTVFTNYVLKENDNILVNIPNNLSNTKFTDKFKYVEKELDILYEDEYLLIVNKPQNMPVHPSSYNYENTLSNIVAYYLSKQDIHNIHIVTRLDKNTTGVCIFAKNAYVQELFLRKKDIINFTKEYIAVVNGIVNKEHDIIEKRIARKKNTIILREINENGDYAKTEYYTLHKNLEKNYSVLKVLLHTGRTHQIRVHMASISHVLLGDELYATEHNVNDIQKYIKRQALHAYKVTFNHPVTNKKMEITASIPEDMKELIPTQILNFQQLQKE